MGAREGNRYPSAWWRRRRAGGWWAELAAGTLATVIGIGLTFGIDSCVTRQREKAEFRKSMLQAVDNLSERFDDTRYWLDRIENQNRVYRLADSTYYATGSLPDSLCVEFRQTMPYIKVSAFDHDFEKIFRGSYQMWQLQTSGDSVVYYIGECYDVLNTVENTCRTLTEGMLEQIGAVNASRHFYRMEPREWTEALITDPHFQYYMSIRRGKTLLASMLFDEEQEEFEAKVLPWSMGQRR